ncbi:MAG: preprotein translocase subunit SecY [Thermoanaerobaculia bacterium]|nr:MAG: preprotein translocase subunit SecY [Thermoanaerobaculia bacterium]MBZ0101335.1 preprotein translocase subunit SecY [Thermoanaerobaculia bacterium]
MLESIRNIFAIPDLRRRLMFTFGLLAVYRVGCHIPTPGVDPKALIEFMNALQSSFLGFVNTFTGGSLERVAVFALGIMPYITASIVLQLMTVVIPYLEKLSKEGELGRRKITQYTRYGTIVVSFIQSMGIALFLEKTSTPGGAPLVPGPGWAFRLMTVLTLTTGCAFVMWLGEQISERGVGNGISLIIFAGIVVGLPSAVAGTLEKIRAGELALLAVIVLIAFMLLVVAFIVYMERAQRRIPVQYAKRQIGRKVYGGQSSYLPLRVNTAGVIPVIFASSLMALPATISQMASETEWLQRIAETLAWGQPLHYLLYVVGIIFFSYFYISIIFNPVDLAENMRKQGSFIPGIRSGKRTAEFIDKVLTRISLVGASYLALVSVLPDFLLNGIRLQSLPWIGPTLDRFMPEFVTQGLGINFYFGGTSLLIVVGVAMDTLQQIESQLVMRNYDGFLKRGRIRGRRG